MPEMSLARRLRNSLKASAGTVVFGMEEGTSGAAAAAVSMMAGTYLEAQTSRDERAASQEPRGAARRRRHGRAAAGARGRPGGDPGAAAAGAVDAGCGLLLRGGADRAVHAAADRQGAGRGRVHRARGGMGIAAALAGVAIGLAIQRGFA